VFTTPRHPYTALLMASAPTIRQHSIRQHSIRQHSVRHDRPLSPHQLRRDGPAPKTGPGACVFADRCPFAAQACAAQPPLTAIGERWSVACHRHEEWGTLARSAHPHEEGPLHAR
jgi:oligopeptide/dipeptide ABC transporter ATP-binding protein